MPDQGTLSRLVGQPRASRVIESMLAAGPIPPLLFSGQPGVGKRTAAFLLAQAANCGRPAGCGVCPSCLSIARLVHPDFRLVFPIRVQKRESTTEDYVEALNHAYPDYVLSRPQPEPDPQRTISIQLARWMRAEATRPPLTARRRFFVILHAHRLTTEATAALLKTLEEPPAHTVYVLCTDSPAFLPGTIRSRCRAVRFGDVPTDALADWLRVRSAADDRQVAAAVAVAQGSPGRALRYLEEPTELMAESVAACFPEIGRASASELAAAAGSTPAGLAARTLLVLYRETLRAGLGLPESPVEAGGILPGRSRRRDQAGLTRILRFLHGRIEDARLTTNPALTSYTLFWVLNHLSVQSGPRVRRQA